MVNVSFNKMSFIKLLINSFNNIKDNKEDYLLYLITISDELNEV